MEFKLDTVLAIVGVVIAVLGLGMAIFLYYYDFKRLLQSTIVENYKVLATYHGELGRRIDRLIRDQEGVLTKVQATHLANLYLDEIRVHLNHALEHYALNDLRGHFVDRKSDLIILELSRAYDTVVRRSIRPMVSPFRLRGGVMFDDLVSSVSEIGVTNALKKISVALDQSFACDDFDLFIAAVQRALLEAGQTGRRLIKRQINQIYDSKRVDSLNVIWSESPD